MTRGNVRRLGAAGLMLAFLIALPGQASAVDVPPTIAIVAPSEPPVEGQPVVFTITRDGDLTLATEVTVATSDGTAVAGEDYTATTQAITFATPDEKTKTFSVPTTDDEFDEDNETVTATVTVVVNGTPASSSATGTIVDGDAPPTVSISGSPSVTEGAQAVFTVTITGKSENIVAVNYAGGGGTATIGGDVTVPSGQFTWNSGDTTTRTITASTIDDAIDEENETYTVNLTGYTSIGSGSATGTIVDGDDPPAVEEVRDVEVTEDNTTANIVVRLSGPSGKTITIDFAPGEGGTADSDDHVPPNGRLTIPAGATQGVIPVAIKEDTRFEGDETVFVNLFGHVNVRPGSDVQGKVTIKDDGDAAAAPTVPNASVAEGNAGLTDLTFSVTLSSPRPQTTFNYRTVAGSADGTDFTEVGGAPLVFPANSSSTPTTLPVTIRVKGDLLDENDETFTLQLLNPTTGAVVASATGTIANDDDNSKLSIGDATADEPGTLRFTVTLSAASARDVGVSWATADGTATAGADYTAGSGTLSFAAGETSKTVEVAVIGDATNEENETLKVVLSNPTGVPAANLLDAQGDGTIIDKNAPPTLSINDVLAREGEGATFTVTLAGTTLRTVTVRFNTTDGTAKAGSDYTARVGTLTFAPGEKSKAIAVTVLDDTAAESVENFSVSLDDAVNATITKNRGVASIEASDTLAATPIPTPTPTPTPRPVGKPASVLVPRMILGPRTVVVGANGIARMLVTCQKISRIGCAGTVELERSVKPLLKLGKRTFSVKKGKKGYASIKLTPRALALLRKSGALRAKVVVIVKTSAKTLKVSPGTILLKSTKPKPKPKAPTSVVVDP